MFSCVHSGSFLLLICKDVFQEEAENKIWGQAAQSLFNNEKTAGKQHGASFTMKRRQAAQSFSAKKMTSGTGHENMSQRYY